MTGSLDPWRTLGLTPGASIDEIRRAYRRLAKVNHPDAAGEGALPRFLAIQAAYETLAGPSRGRRPGSRPGPAKPAQPWRADPERARASSGTDARRRPPPGSRPSGTKGPGAASSPRSAPGGATGEQAPPNSRTKAGRPADAGTPRRPPGRRRPPNRATPGSTSYDAADEDPFEPGWSGGTWYGASSGTYWTINPKEYADPRKHGPEYQRRARRSASGGWIIDGDSSTEPDADEDSRRSFQEPAGDDAPDPPIAPQRGRRRRAAAGPSAAGASGTSAAGEDAAEPGDATAAGAAVAPRPSWTSAGREPGERGPVRAGPPPAGLGGSRTTSSHDGFAAPLLRTPVTPAGRLGLALLGWPPLGVAVATAIGESSGCGRFAASCAEVFSPGTWIVQVAIVLLLFALPRIAGWSAVGTLVALAAAIPTAVALSAGGG